MFHVKTTRLPEALHKLAENAVQMRRIAHIVLTLLVCPAAHAQGQSGIEAIMALAGVSDEDSLDADEVERLGELLQSPLPINMASAARLEESGLFTRYQIASLTDYLTRHGDILSVRELAAVDGFGDSRARLLAPFISFDSRKLPGAKNGNQLKVFNSIAARTALKSVGKGEERNVTWNYGMKYRIEAGDFLQASFSLNRSYAAPSPAPELYSGNIIWYFRKIMGKLTAGDFNARFGQGLALWNGMFMTSLDTPDAFMKKPSGISGTWSFTGTSAIRGIAADFQIGRFAISALTAHPGVAALNSSWHGRSGHVSLTSRLDASLKPGAFRLSEAVTSIDAAFCLKGVNLFGEVAWYWSAKHAAAVFGADFRAGEYMRMAALLRSIDASRYGGAISGKLNTRRHEFVFAAESDYYSKGKPSPTGEGLQIKCNLNWKYEASSGFFLKVRFSERVRSWGPMFRTDLRTDVGYSAGPFSVQARFDVLKCVSPAALCYLEGGYKDDRCSVYLRQGAFLIDNWEDRIYVYERDAPGSFNVPAFYGRGLWSSLAGGCRFGKIARLYARASYICYPFMDEQKKKPGKAELKLQCVFRF